MYKALIIDDEEPARRAIHALGAWQEHSDHFHCGSERRIGRV